MGGSCCLVYLHTLALVKDLRMSCYSVASPVRSLHPSGMVLSDMRLTFRLCLLCSCRFAGIGGLSEALGWTEVQQEYKQGQFAGGFENILKLVAVVLAADLALFGWEYVQYLTGATQ